MRIALSMMNQVWENKSANMEICDFLAKESSQYEADFLVFPEMTLTGFTLETLQVAEAIESSLSMQYFSSIASAHQINIVAGLVLKDGDQFQNCAVAYGRHGGLLSQYAKIHPFSIAGENEQVSAGDQLANFECEGIRFGLTVCYDLRFPLMWSALADKCDCVINIANWPARRVDHWKTLLQARAIENQIYVIGVNRIGRDGNALEYVQSSCAFDPDGAMISPIVLSEGISVVEIEEAALKRIRENFPVRKDRRSVLYKSFLYENHES